MAFRFDLQLFATKKGGGSSKNGRDSKSKRLGVKRHGGQLVAAGNIIGAAGHLVHGPERRHGQTTRCARWWTATSSSSPWASGARVSVYPCPSA